MVTPPGTYLYIYIVPVHRWLMADKMSECPRPSDFKDSISTPPSIPSHHTGGTKLNADWNMQL